MATKSKAKSEPQKQIPKIPDKAVDPVKRTAFFAASPFIRGGAAAEKYAQPMFGDVMLDAYLAELREQTDAVKAGDMSGVETMLMTQANTLDMIFNQLARKAAGCEFLNQFQAHLILALKAQAQSRATLEALAEIRNPRPVAFVRQANIANGPQQVNNGAKDSAPPDTRARGQNGEPTNELLTDERDGQTLDPGSTGAAGASHPSLATVGKLNRPAQ